MVQLQDDPSSAQYAAALKDAQAAANAQFAKAIASATSRAQVKAIQQQQSSQKIRVSSAVIQQVRATTQRLDQAQKNLLGSLTSPAIGGQVIFRTQKAYNGIAMYVTPDKISAIAALPGVKSVHAMVTKYPTAFSDIDFLGARQFWNPPTPAPSPNGLGLHGENIKVADLDTGLDYIHTDFGGPGSSGYAAVPNHTAPSNPYFPTQKVPGGFDFAGDAYNGSNVPSPDPDPFDGAGHGTGTASLIGGFGVTSTGLVYPGTYDSTTPIASLKIAPGFAPQCKIYPVRLFGNSGGTNLTIQGIEWAMDPNGDSNFNDHMDVMNMSFGSPEGFPDDPDEVAAASAAAVGVIVCSSAGNDADTYFNVGGPSTAPGTLSVAASFNDQAGWIADSSVAANSAGAGAPVGGKYFSLFANNSSPRGPVTGDVVHARPDNAGTALTPANAAAMNGHIALVMRGGGFANVANNCQAAGAIGIITYQNVRPPPDPGDPVGQNTTGATLTVPNVMITMADGNSIKAAANFDPTTGVPTNPCNVTIQPDNAVITHGGAAPDTLASYSSRGPRSGDMGFKPDITIPAEVTGVALIGTGNQVATFNGTSSSAPHLTGTMALARQLHPTWTVAELNALICNTATHDLFTTTPAPSPSPTPPVEYGVGRVGAGRMDIAKASGANVVAWNQGDSSTGVSFGAVEVPVDGGVNLVKNVFVENKGVSSVTYNLTYQDVTPVAGTSFAVPANITIPAGSSANIPVTFTAIAGTTLKHARETSVLAQRSYAVFGSPIPPQDRHWLTEKTGYLVMTPTGGSEPTIRVGLYANPKPASSMHATISGFVPTGPTGSFNISLTGSQINTGPSYGGGFDILSLVKPSELQYASPLVGSPSAPTDPNILKYVGISTDFVTNNANPTPTRISWSIDSFGNFTVPTQFDLGDRRIIIDSNQDGIDDFEIDLLSLGFAIIGPSQQAVDNVYYGIVTNLHTNAGATTFQVNGFDPQQFDTNIFNNSATMVSVRGSQIGLPNGNPNPWAFNYRVEIHDRAGNTSSSTGELSFDAANPGLDSSAGGLEPSMFADTSGGSIPVNYNGQNFRNNASIGVMLMHMHNGSGNRSDAVLFRKPTITSFSPSHGGAGAFVTITGSNFNGSTAVTFNNHPAASVTVLSPTTIMATVPALSPQSAATGRIRVSNAAGTSTSLTNFTSP